MFLDWLVKIEEGTTEYEELKMLAQERSSWRQWRWKPAISAECYRERGIRSQNWKFCYCM